MQSCDLLATCDRKYLHCALPQSHFPETFGSRHRFSPSSGSVGSVSQIFSLFWMWYNYHTSLLPYEKKACDIGLSCSEPYNENTITTYMCTHSSSRGSADPSRQKGHNFATKPSFCYRALVKIGMLLVLSNCVLSNKVDQKLSSPLR